MMRSVKLRNIGISIFVILWIILFHYESTRFFYLSPLLKRDLPQIKFLFPPAGWIMFYNVDEQYGLAEVYGVKKNPNPSAQAEMQLLDPHMIFRTRAIGYDNINRNVLGTILSQSVQHPFCNYLKMRFGYFDNFLITYVHYPAIAKAPFVRTQQVVYQCW